MVSLRTVHLLTAVLSLLSSASAGPLDGRKAPVAAMPGHHELLFSLERPQRETDGLDEAVAGSAWLEQHPWSRLKRDGDDAEDGAAAQQGDPPAAPGQPGGQGGRKVDMAKMSLDHPPQKLLVNNDRVVQTKYTCTLDGVSSMGSVIFLEPEGDQGDQGDLGEQSPPAMRHM